ncbi:MAG: hypothetical protein HY842_02610 [Bacteroidetes bacterium]|nr:hypothetical protein [Bacteroidota bacterium]
MPNSSPLPRSGQIKTFADLAASQSSGSNLLAWVEAYYARAARHGAGREGSGVGGEGVRVKVPPGTIGTSLVSPHPGICA